MKLPIKLTFISTSKNLRSRNRRVDCGTVSDDLEIPRGYLFKDYRVWSLLFGKKLKTRVNPDQVLVLTIARCLYRDLWIQNYKLNDDATWLRSLVGAYLLTNQTVRHCGTIIYLSIHRLFDGVSNVRTPKTTLPCAQCFFFQIKK